MIAVHVEQFDAICGLKEILRGWNGTLSPPRSSLIYIWFPVNIWGHRDLNKLEYMHGIYYVHFLYYA